MTQYDIIKSETAEISASNHSATFTFTVFRDEPYQDDNKVWLNWGVFDGPFDDSTDKIYGKKTPLAYDMALTYSDYFDRVFINGILYLIGLSGTFGFWFAAPIQLVPMAALAIYLMLHPVWIFFTAPANENLTFDNYISEVFWRWQFGYFWVMIFLLLSDAIGYAPFGYLIYQY